MAITAAAPNRFSEPPVLTVPPMLTLPVLESLYLPAIRSAEALSLVVAVPFLASLASSVICAVLGVVTVRLPTFTTPLAPTTTPFGSAKITLPPILPSFRPFSVPLITTWVSCTRLTRLLALPGTLRLTVLPALTLKLPNELKPVLPRTVVVEMSVTVPLVVMVVAVVSPVSEPPKLPLCRVMLLLPGFGSAAQTGIAPMETSRATVMRLGRKRCT